MKKIFSKKLLSVLLAISVLSGAMLVGGLRYNTVSALAEKEQKVVTESMVNPNSSNIKSWGWDGTVTGVDDGVHVKMNVGYPSAYTVRLTQPVILNESAISFTFTSGYAMLFMLSGSISSNPGNSLCFKLAPEDPNGQLFISSGGKTHSLADYEDHNQTYPDRINSAKLLNKREYTISFKTSGKNVSVNINGYTMELNADMVTGATSLTDLSNVYFSFAPSDNSVLDYNIHTITNGEKAGKPDPGLTGDSKTVYDAIEAIETVTTESGDLISNARTLYDALSDEEKSKITNYQTLLSAESMFDGIEDVHFYPVRGDDIFPTQDMNSSWMWPVNFSVLDDDSYRIAFSSPVTFYHFYRIKNVTPDNLHIKIRVHGAGDFVMSFASKDEEYFTGKPISFRIYPAQSKILVMLGATVYETLDNVSAVNDATAYDMRWIANENGGYVIRLNGSDVYTVTPELINAATSFSAALQKNALWFNLSSEGYATVYDIISVHSGNDICASELANKYGVDEVKKINVAIKKIEAIGPVQADSGYLIETAKAAYDSVLPDLKKYVSNYSVLQTAIRLYNKITSTDLDLDYVTYAIMLSQVGPNNYWKDDSNKPIVWNGAETEPGVEIKFKDATIHDAGINVNNSLKFDGLHIEFGSTEITGGGRNFSLILAEKDQQNYLEGRVFSIDFLVLDDRVKISYSRTADNSSVSLIDTPYVYRENMKNGWDIRFDKQKDGSYEVLMCGVASGTIPVDVISAIEEDGLNMNDVHITFGMCNIGAAPGILNIVIKAIHDGNSTCFSAVPADCYKAISDCMVAIDAIGEVSEASSSKLNDARAKYDAIEEKYHPLVTNYRVLTAAEKDYSDIYNDIRLSSVVIKLISDLPEEVSKGDRTQITQALGAYLDLFPRIRDKVVNYPKLKAAVEKYQSIDPTANLENDTLNNREIGVDLNAYLKEVSNGNILSPRTGDSFNNAIYIALIINLIVTVVLAGLLLKKNMVNGN